MTKKTIIILLLTFSAVTYSYSQTFFSLSYEPSTPLGDMRTYIEKSSLRGLNANASRYLNDHLSVGLNLQWTGFYQKEERHTWSFEGGAITATAWKEFYIIPIYANARYHLKTEEESALLPYIGFNLGVAYVEQLLQISDVEEQGKYWKFAFAPEIGTLIPMGMDKHWGLNIMLRYQAIAYNENDINLMHFLNYSLGVYWKIYKREEEF